MIIILKLFHVHSAWCWAASHHPIVYLFPITEHPVNISQIILCFITILSCETLDKFNYIQDTYKHYLYFVPSNTNTETFSAEAPINVCHKSHKRDTYTYTYIFPCLHITTKLDVHYSYTNLFE